MKKDILIFGGGGFAREVAWLIEDVNRSVPGAEGWNIVGFVEHSKERVGQQLNGIPIIDIDESKLEFSKTYVSVAIGDTGTRSKAVKQAQDLRLTFATLIHPSVIMDRSTLNIGEGCIICAGNILTVNITLGNHVIVNLDCTIGHDSFIEDFVTLSPGCHLSGFTTIRRGAYLGTGATTIERHEIGEGAIVGAGAVVVKDIPAKVTAVGIPATPVK